jgi:hypothetical protein
MTVLKSHLRIGNKLGQGHFGAVFLADDPIHGADAGAVTSAAVA